MNQGDQRKFRNLPFVRCILAAIRHGAVTERSNGPRQDPPVELAGPVQEGSSGRTGLYLVWLRTDVDPFAASCGEIAFLGVEPGSLGMLAVLSARLWECGERFRNVRVPVG